MSPTSHSPAARHSVNALLLGLLIIALTGLSWIGGNTRSEAAMVDTPPVSASSAPTTLVSAESELINVVAQAEPAVAALNVNVAGERMGTDEATGSRSSGSGFLIAADNRRVLITNFHVVQDALQSGTTEMRESAEIQAIFPGVNEPVTLEVQGVNPSFDLALLTPISGQHFPAVTSLPIADSDLVVAGQSTIAVGNPFGIGATVTTGIISATERFVPSVGNVSVPMLQTDAAINPGNSGGPLLNSAGELIGVNTAIFNPESRSFAGIGFAVPSNLVLEALANLDRGGVSTIADSRPSFGARLGSLAELPEAVRVELDLPASGAIVLQVIDGSPAALAGLRGPDTSVTIAGQDLPVGGDIITSFDGTPIRNANDLIQAVRFGSERGQNVDVTVLRDGVMLSIPVVLG